MVDRSRGLSIAKWSKRDRSICATYVVVLLTLCLLIMVMVPWKNESMVASDPAFRDVGEQTPQGPSTRMETKDILSENGQTSEGSTTSKDFEVPANMTSMVLTFTWTDDSGSNDRFYVAIHIEDNVMRSAESDSGYIELYDEWDVPITAHNLSVHITAVICPGTITNSPLDLDDGNDWSLTISAEVQVVVDEGGASR